MQNPIFKPGDQKVFAPQGDTSSSSHRVNIAYLVLLIGAVILGISCLLIGEWVAGIIFTLVGIVGAVYILKQEISEKQMVRRMRLRD